MCVSVCVIFSQMRESGLKKKALADYIPDLCVNSYHCWFYLVLRSSKVLAKGISVFSPIDVQWWIMKGGLVIVSVFFKHIKIGVSTFWLSSKTPKRLIRVTRKLKQLERIMIFFFLGSKLGTTWKWSDQVLSQRYNIQLKKKMISTD